MRILFVLENYYPSIGGVETLFKSLADELASQGIHVTVITNNNHNLPVKSTEGNHIVYRYRLRNRYAFTFLAWWYVYKHGRHADLIHTTSYNAALPAWIGSKLSGAPVLITFHEVWGKLWFQLPFFSTFSKWGHYAFEHFILRLPFTHWIAVSNYTRDQLIESGIDSHITSTIYNGIDYDDTPNGESKSKSSTYSFLYFGRLGISKGLDLLIPAYANLKQAGIDCSLTIIIPDQPRALLKKIQNLIHQQPDHLRPQLMPQVSRACLDNMIQEADAVVVPSYSEGFGYAALEAVSLGTPVVHSGRGALKEVVSGKHIQMKSHTVDGLTQAMKDAVEQKWSRASLKKFDLHDTINGYISLYHRILTQSK